MIPLWAETAPSIIAFTGFKGSGKSAAAQALVQLGYQVHSLAAPIKAAVKAMGVPPQALSSANKEEPLELLCGRSPRYAMQTLGTEWRDLMGQDLWLRIWDATKPEGQVVIDDLRFPHEADWVKARGGLLFRIVRPFDEYGNRTKSVDLHPSEAGQLSIQPDETIMNVGDERTLQIVVRESLERMMNAAR